MNRRIKKKLKKKALNSTLQFGIYPHKRVSTVKTYRELKNERKKLHELGVRVRHEAFKRQGYDYQLKDVRVFRKDYRTSFTEDMKRRLCEG